MLTSHSAFVSLLEIMETYFQPYAVAFLEHVASLEFHVKYIEEHQIQNRDKAHDCFIQSMAKSCKSLAAMTETLGLIVATHRLKAAMFEADPVFFIPNIVKVAQIAKEAVNALKVEIKSIQFLPIGIASQKYINTNFGESVAVAFPNCADDISETNTCFALGRYTASMFHLGRVMESVTKLLGKKIKAKTPPTDDWQRWLSAINEIVSAMPFKTPKARKKREPIAEAAAYLLHFKEAWRNKTMHPERSYTQEQAVTIIEGAKAFLNGVATRIFKVKVKTS